MVILLFCAMNFVCVHINIWKMLIALVYEKIRNENKLLFL